MVKGTPEVLLDGLVFPEGPRWHEGKLWFSDMNAYEVVTVDLDGHRETVAKVPQWPPGLGFLPDGRLLVVSMADRKLLRLDPGRLTEAADMSALASFCNDMVVDKEGRAYVGDMGSNPFADEPRRKGSLLLVTPEAGSRVAADDIEGPNGTVITLDGRTLILAETRKRRLLAFDIEADGSLSNRRVWAQLDGPPDGICLDAEGCVWVGVLSSPGAFVRVVEGGEIKDRIDLAERHAIACMLGGPQRRTLFMLEAFEGGRAAESRGPGNGRISVVEVEVPGAGLP